MSRRLLAMVDTPLVLMALLTAVVLLGSLGDATLDRVVVTMMINLIVVIGLYTFTGNSGVFSFGHTAFMLIGAYVAALLRMPVDVKRSFLPGAPSFLVDAHIATLPAVLIGGLVAAALAVVVAVPLTRLSGLTAGLATFAVLNIVYVVGRNWDAVTNGTRGLGPVPITTTRDTALLWALIAIAAAYAFQESRFGLRLRASREDEVASRAIGVRVARERGIAFVLSAFIVAVSGGLYGQYLGSFTPDAFFLALTFLTLSMLVVGGLTSLSGAVVGTIVVSAVAELLRRIESGVDLGAFRLSAPSGLREVGIAVLIVAILALRPEGITGTRELALVLPRRLRGPGGRRADAEREPVATLPDLAGRGE